MGDRWIYLWNLACHRATTLFSKIRCYMKGFPCRHFIEFNPRKGREGLGSWGLPLELFMRSCNSSTSLNIKEYFNERNVYDLGGRQFRTPSFFWTLRALDPSLHESIKFNALVVWLTFAEEVACADPDKCKEVCGNPSGCYDIAYPYLVLRILPVGQYVDSRTLNDACI